MNKLISVQLEDVGGDGGGNDDGTTITGWDPGNADAWFAYVQKDITRQELDSFEFRAAVEAMAPGIDFESPGHCPTRLSHALGIDRYWVGNFV